jgi:hypothetical protein
MTSRNRQKRSEARQIALNHRQLLFHWDCLQFVEKYAVRAGGGANHHFGLDDPSSSRTIISPSRGDRAGVAARPRGFRSSL